MEKLKSALEDYIYIFIYVYRESRCLLGCVSGKLVSGDLVFWTCEELISVYIYICQKKSA